MKKKLLKALPVVALLIAMLGLVLPVAPLPVIELGSTERVGQITFITSDMDPVINMANLGNRMDLDADNNTSIRASADDVIDFEVAGEDDFQMAEGIFTIGNAQAEDDVIIFDGIAQDFYLALDDSVDDFMIGVGSTVGANEVIMIDEDANLVLGKDQAFTFGSMPVANAGGDMFDFTATLGISDGADDDFIFYDINLTGSATEAARDVIGLDLTLTDGADTDYLPVGLKLQPGWDTYMILGAAADGFTFSELPIAGTVAGDSIDFTETLNTSSNASADYIFMDVNITGSATEAARDVVGIDLTLTDGADTDYVPVGMKISAGWDTYLIMGAAADGFAFTEIPVADAGGDSIDFTETLAVSDADTDDYIFMDVNITGSGTESARDIDFLNLNFTDGAGAAAIGRGLVMDAGFDNWIVLAGDTGAGVVWQPIPAADAGGDSIDFTETLNTSNAAGDNYIFLDVNLTSSATEDARGVNFLDLSYTDGSDVDAIGRGLVMDAGFDEWVNFDSDTFVFQPVPANSAGGDSIDFTDTLGTSDDTADDYIFMDVNITGSATEAARDVVGIDLGFTDGAGTASLAYAIELQAGWDSYLYVDSGTFNFTPIPVADAGGDSIDFTEVLNVSNADTDDYIFMDINLTGSGTESARDIDFLNLNFTDGAGAAAIGRGLIMDAGFDQWIVLAGDTGAGVVWQPIPVADAGGDSFDFTDTLNVSDGTDDDYIFMDINITGSATEAARDAVGIDLDFVVGAGTSIVSKAIELQSGWSQYLDIDSGTLVIAPAPAANATGDTIDFTDTLASTDGTDYYTFLDVNITEGASATGTDTIMGIDLNFTADDGSSIPTAINLGAGWDVDINAATDLDVGVGGEVIATLINWPAGDGATTTNLLELIDSSPTDTTGINTHQALVIDIGVGSSTAGTNNVRGIMIDEIVDDDVVVTTAIEVGDEWNYALDTSAPVLASAMHWFDDFIGDTLIATYTEISGADPQALQGIVEEQYGVLQLTSGDVGDTPANDLEAVTLSLEWMANQGSLVMEARLHMDTAVTASAMCVGFNDDVATVEMPFTIAGGDAITSNADDAVAFCYDTDSDADTWFFLGVDGTTDSTGNGTTGVAPTQGAYQVFRIEIDSGGEKARGYINGALVGTLTANAVQINVLLAPWVGVDAHEAVSHTVDIDYIYASADRD